MVLYPVAPPEIREPIVFAQRLRAALVAADFAISAVAIQREFNEQSGDAPVTVHAVRKWITGEAIPTQRRVQILSTWLGVSASWLRFGEEVTTGASRASTAGEQVLLRNFRRLGTREREHLLALIQTMAGKR